MKVKYLKYMPLERFVELELKPTEMIFVAILVSFTTDDKTLRAGQDNISEAMGVSPATVKRLIPRLKDKGLISVVSGKAQRNANVYYPSTKLMGLYGQNDLINRVKMTNHTPKGYSKEEAFLRKLPLKERKLAELHIKEYGRSIDEVMKYLTKGKQ